MLIFTVKAIRLLDGAFLRYGNDAQRALWRNWGSRHTAVRRSSDDPIDDGSGPMPDDVKRDVLEVLAAMYFARMGEREKITSEDDLADLDNDLAYINSVKHSIENPPARV